MSASDEEFVEFAKGLHGELIRPEDAKYDEARRIWNAMIDRRPAVIVRCKDADDVIQSIAFAKEHEFVLAVRGAGHNVSGNAVCDDGLVIDLSLMKDIRVDEERRTAVVGGGVTWGEFDQAAQRVGLATTGGVVPATGVAGLTLGGGSGFLARTRGLACDNLLGVDLVTAEGRVTHANEQENPDLFWGVRGGGGNFGVATSFAFRLHPVGAILGGVLVHPMRRARELLRFYGKFVEGAPDELTLFAALGTSPDGVPVAVILAGYFGPLDEGERILRPIREFGPPILDDIKRMSYVDLQGILGPAYPPGAPGGVYVNCLGGERDEGAERVRAAYDPEKYERLVRLKRKYDPENRFRMNQNIPP